ncbi:hypothetical protein DYU11_11610 [Fibrisoma montanum]|uniref:Uncharacterized protein n=1 Tax=Fibrisoma montanum TaxID=2305895 RepID=A0A418MB71_9BACT|nr:hypothetical protein [Fibrisoma montanum]RIV23621.1 hypothetical protein DYU11_11610 [Fibrisoma montanum]
METKKVITPIGTMSNLVGMYAYIWDGDVLRYRCFISGKCDEFRYIVQAIDNFTGEPNVARIVHIKKMVDWQILPTRAIADEVDEFYFKEKRNGYKFDYDKPRQPVVKEDLDESLLNHLLEQEKQLCE